MSEPTPKPTAAMRASALVIAARALANYPMRDILAAAEWIAVPSWMVPAEPPAQDGEVVPALDLSQFIHAQSDIAGVTICGREYPDALLTVVWKSVTCPKCLERRPNPDPAPHCVAHGVVRCKFCSRIEVGNDDGHGGCKSCEPYATDGMHWDTCPHRIRGPIAANRTELLNRGLKDGGA